MLQCEFESPVYWDNDSNSLVPNDASLKPVGNWQFSKVKCSGDLDFSTSTFPGYMEQITSQDTQKSFFLNKQISYGDFLITSFFILLILGLAFSGIRDFAKNRKLERL